MKPSAFVYLLLCLIVTLGSCKEDDEWGPCPEPPPLQKINPILLDYLFDNGSQWIYHNASDSTLDTVTQENIARVIQSYDQIGGTAHQTGGCPVTTITWETFSVHCSSTQDGGFQEWVGRDAIGRSGIVGTILFSCEANVGETVNNATLEAIHDSLIIGNHTFSPVIQMLARLANTSLMQRFYYSPDVGVVRREFTLYDSVYAAYNLIDWQVTPYPYQ